MFSDKEDPNMTCIEDNDMVAWQMPIATDNSGDIRLVICYQQLDANDATDQATITCEACDRSGNKVHCSFQVRIPGRYY